MRLRNGAKRSRVSEQEANEVEASTSSRENQKGNSKAKRAETLATDQPKIEVMQAGAGLRKKYVRRLKFLKEVMKEADSSLPKEEMNLHKEHCMGRHQQEDGLLEIKQPKSVLQITQSPSVDNNAAAGVLEEVREHDRATEVESSEISGLEQAGSQTMSTEMTDSQIKITEVAGESGRTLRENEEQSQLICHENDLVGLTGDNELEAGQDLPFVKSLEIWKAVESMEIFKVMPQKPHFHSLVESKEILREGLAIGYMLNFASLVQKTFESTVADPRNLFTTILDALPEFEILGFDVKAVRDRTSLLQSMKDRHGHLRHHSKEVILQANQCSDELTKINEDIDANQRMLRELEDKQADLLSRKKSKMSEITSLKVCADDTAKAIKNLEADFESLAGSSW
ncbi:hypothetical protein HRI_002961800 [Hibiscus trionum]|uniref:Uncharacterized protein n=1 Tax=Hibiscus trionum TaxID=183268 RepID=A0A9W7IAQ1_HIBTR|nr:hypothetical protein HRI_002961800 [Hibiscus trionum]